VAKRGADEMADRYLIENREAAVGVQVFHVRQRWGAAIRRAQTQVLLGRLKYALPGWEEAESRRAADTAAEASCRSHASGSGARGFDADSWLGRRVRRRCGSWVAPTGTPQRWPATRALGCGGRTSCGCVDTACARSPRGPGPCFFGGGALRCLADSGAPPPKKLKCQRTGSLNRGARAAQKARRRRCPAISCKPPINEMSCPDIE
jgi:hypothetical protein